MRVLYIPHTSSPDLLETDHAYSWSTTFFSRWMKRNPNVIVYWVVPLGASVKQRDAFYKFEGMMNRLKLIEMPTNPHQITEQCTFSEKLSDMFCMHHGDYFFDVLVCEKASILSLFLGQCQFLNRIRASKIIIVNFHYSINCDKESHVLKCLERNQTMGALEADIIQFASAGNGIDSRGLWLKKIRDNFSCKLIKKSNEIPAWVKPCADLEEVKRVKENWECKKSEKFTVHYGCSINTLFSFDKVYDVMKQFKKIDKDIGFRVTSPIVAAGKLVGTIEDWVDLTITCPRRKFYQKALRSHVFVTWTNAPHGVNHGSTIEMARLGLVPVFCSKSIPYPWTNEYPFLFKNSIELLNLLKWLKKNYNSDKVKNTVNENTKMLDDLYDNECSYDKQIDFIEDMFEEKLKSVKVNCPSKNILQDLPNTISIDNLYRHIKKESYTNIDYASKTRPYAGYYIFGTRDELRTYMLSNGYDDVGTPDEVIFNMGNS